LQRAAEEWQKFSYLKICNVKLLCHAWAAREILRRCRKITKHCIGKKSLKALVSEKHAAFSAENFSILGLIEKQR